MLDVNRSGGSSSAFPGDSHAESKSGTTLGKSVRHITKNKIEGGPKSEKKSILLQAKSKVQILAKKFEEKKEVSNTNLFGKAKRKNNTELGRIPNELKQKPITAATTEKQISQRPIPPKPFAMKIIQRLTGPKGAFTVAKNGKIFFKEPEGKETGYTLESLKKMIQTTDKSDKLIAIKMKYGSVSQGTGKTFIYAFDLKGNQVYTAEKIKRLGEGNFGVAYAYKTENSQEEVIKLAKTHQGKGESRILIPENTRSRAVRDVQWEADILERLHMDENRNPVLIPGLQLPPKKVIILKGGVKEEKRVGHIGAKYSGDCGDKRLYEVWKVNERFNGIKDLGFALQYCHKNNVFLGDIKPENIFRDDNAKKLYLADLGGSVYATDKEKIRVDGLIVTPGQISREDYQRLKDIQSEAAGALSENEKLLNEYKELTGKIDVHALGVSLLEMLVPDINLRDPIWDNPLRARNIRNSIPELLVRADLPRDVAKKLGTLLQNMTDPNSKKRPTSAQVHEILQSIPNISQNEGMGEESRWASTPKDEYKLEKLQETALPIIKELLQKSKKPIRDNEILEFIENFPEKSYGEDIYNTSDSLDTYCQDDHVGPGDFFFDLLYGSVPSIPEGDLINARNSLKEAYDKLNQGRG